MRFHAMALAIGLSWTTAAHADTAPAPATAIHQAQIEARIQWEPRSIPGSDGLRHLAYELHITNFSSDDKPLTLTRLSVFADDASLPLLNADREAVSALLAHPPEKEAGANGVAIEPGHRQTLFLWLTLPGGVVPKRIRQQLDFRTASGDLQRAENVTNAVADRLPVPLGPPLRGGSWLAVEGPGDWHSHHWGSLVAINGALTIPQRFASDWFRLDHSAHSIRGNHASPAATTDADWVGFDSEVLAVAEGVVRDVRNDAPDGTPLAPQPVPEDLTVRTLYGNFVVLEIAPGVFAHYAHLRKGSVTVKIGDRVSRGSVIGRLGQSGAAGAPHLHLHLSDRPTFEESEGLPFTIDAFSLLGKTRIEQTFDTAVPVSLGGAAPGDRRNEMPLDGDVVRFAQP